MTRSQDTAQAKVEVDWACVIQDFATQHDMTIRETLRWIARRSSLQVACEIFGIPLSPSIAIRYTRQDELTLYSLGDLLHNAGFSVPRLMEHHRVPYKPREVKRVGFSLSKEEYLLERAAGKSKNRIAHDQGISGPALFHWLEKWNLKDAAVEAQEIERLTGWLRPVSAVVNVDKPAPEAGIEQASAAAREVSSDVTGHHAVASTQGAPSFSHVMRRINGSRTTPMEPLTFPRAVEPRAARQGASGDVRITLQLPLDLITARSSVSVEVQSSDRASSGITSGQASDPALPREERMHQALAELFGALELAYRDLSDMLGEEEAREKIQQYADRQVCRFLARF